MSKRLRRLWEQVWEGQNKKCAGCGCLVKLEDTAKNANSFPIVCRKCYECSAMSIVIRDEYANFMESSEVL